MRMHAIQTGTVAVKQRLGSARALIPPVALPAQLTSSVTFLLSDDATNINGAILPSDGGWFVQ
jgi:NAD(P)-dependent dehydrogenase (short-subunit alcohol dehydrogenase family)